MYQPSVRILLAILAFCGCSIAARIKTVYEWKYIDYMWQNSQQKQDAINSRVYNYTRIIPIDFQKISGDRVLITTPRYHNNPASLSTVSKDNGPGGLLLEPYPSWDWHKQGNCSGITSVSRVIVDKCNRLWVVDSGKVGNRQRCPAQILAFDMRNDKLLKRVRIPKRFSHSSTNSSRGRLEIQFVDTEGDSCRKTWVYIGDPEGYGMVIWDGSDIWRLESDIFVPDPLASTYIIGLDEAYLQIGVSIFLTLPPGFVDKDYLFFKPLSSLNDFTARIKHLRNSKTGCGVPYWKGTITLPTQELARAFSPSGVLVGGLSTGSQLACYYLQNPLALEYIGIAASDPVRLQFASSGKVVRRANSPFKKEEYWEMTNRLQKFASGTVDFNETNFRIVRVNIAELIEELSVCQPVNRTVQTIEDKSFYRHGYISTVIL